MRLDLVDVFIELTLLLAHKQGIRKGGTHGPASFAAISHVRGAPNINAVHVLVRLVGQKHLPLRDDEREE